MTKIRKTLKTQKTQMSVFTQNRKLKIFSFCVITFEPIIAYIYQAPQKDRQNLKFLTNFTYGEKMVRNGPTEVIYKFCFVSKWSLPYKTLLTKIIVKDNQM